MKTKRIQKKAFKLSIVSRIKLLFGIVPKDLKESRGLFKTATHPFQPSLIERIKIRLSGKVRMYSPIWIKSYTAWVKACGKDMRHLKDAFYSTSYLFPTKVAGRENNPLRNIVVPAILPLVSLKTNHMHVDGNDLHFLAINGGHMGMEPYSDWQQAALLKWCQLHRDITDIYWNSNLFVKDSSPYMYVQDVLHVKLDNTRVLPA